MRLFSTFSLPRPKEKRHKVREFSCKLDFDHLRLKRAKSLEQMLDSGSGSGSSSTSATATTFSTSLGVAGPNVWVADSARKR